MKSLFIGALALALCTDAAAYFVWGTGKDLCSDYIGAKIEFEHRGATADHLAHVNWVKGFITGINWAKDSEVAKDLSIDDVRNWLDGYCRQNMQDTVAHAAEAMVMEFERAD